MWALRSQMNSFNESLQKSAAHDRRWTNGKDIHRFHDVNVVSGAGGSRNNQCKSSEGKNKGCNGARRPCTRFDSPALLLLSVFVDLYSKTALAAYCDMKFMKHSVKIGFTARVDPERASTDVIRRQDCFSEVGNNCECKFAPINCW